ncbi:MAG: hypothetical protein ACRD1K_08380 [Acidimicrobiales bacterium]
MQCFSLRGTAGDVLRIRRIPQEVTNDLAPRVQVLNPDGSQLCSSAPDFDCTLTIDGEHVLVTEPAYAVSGRCR